MVALADPSCGVGSVLFHVEEHGNLAGDEPSIWVSLCSLAHDIRASDSHLGHELHEQFRQEPVGQLWLGAHHPIAPLCERPRREKSAFHPGQC